MPFKRFVETGRVALVSDGQFKGKLVAIVDIIDQNRVLVDGPLSKVPRGEMRLSQLHLTKFRLKFPFTGSTRVVRKAWTDYKLKEKWLESAWAKKLKAKKKRLAMGDFDRFKLRRARSRRNKIRSTAFLTLRKTAARNGTLFGKKTKGGDKPKPKKAAASKKDPAATKAAPAKTKAPAAAKDPAAKAPAKPKTKTPAAAAAPKK